MTSVWVRRLRGRPASTSVRGKNRSPIISSVLAALLAAIPNASVNAQEALQPLRTDTPPVIDGILDDPVWQSAPHVSEFKTYQPDYGSDMAGETTVYMAYDGRNLYFAFRALDREPDKIKASVTSRDNIWREDWVAINLDSFHDQQSLYAFYVNPMGIQGDSRYAAGNEDRSFDMVWYSGGHVDDSGYTIEIRIPLKSIRFATTSPVNMGVIFERHISRRSEFGTCPPLDPDQGDSWLTQMAPMTYHGIERHTLVELLPAATYIYDQAVDQGQLATAERRGEVSLTAKYGITSDLVVDGTYNPDFSQVEADAGQVDINLRYDLYFPEKRPFFLEGREHFGLAASAASETDPLQSIVYTRTIADPVAGVRLSGKIGSRNTVASIYAADELPTTDTASGAAYAHFPVLRYKRALSEDSYVGGIYTGRELSNHFNRVLGVDGLFRLTESSTGGFHGMLSRTKADAGSPAVSGHSFGIHYTRGTRNVDYSLVAKEISRDFQVETGFITRTGLLQFSGLLRPKFYPNSRVVRRIDAELFTAQSRDAFSGRWETFNHISFLHYLWGSLLFKLKYSYSTEIFLGQRFQTGGYHVYGGGQFTNRLFFSVLYRNVKAIFYSADPYQGRSNRLTADLVIQPSDKLRSEVNLTYYDFSRQSDAEKIYDYAIARGKVTYQLSKYLFFRGILEYNDYRRQLLADLLASFTYIPGTVIHVGYGSLREKIRWQNGEYVESDQFLETKRRFFFKASYLWRI